METPQPTPNFALEWVAWSSSPRCDKLQQALSAARKIHNATGEKVALTVDTVQVVVFKNWEAISCDRSYSRELSQMVDAVRGHAEVIAKAAPDNRIALGYCHDRTKSAEFGSAMHAIFGPLAFINPETGDIETD